MGLFDKRISFKPFEYPEVAKFKDAIHHSFWLVSEFNFSSDVHDFQINISDSERNALKNALLAISQIEISVKKFWAKLGDHIPKAEFDQVGIAFANSEVIHSDAYSHLLNILGLNDEFSTLVENPVIQGRIEYLTKYLKGASDNNKENYTLSLALFAMFIENVSLFSQFLIIKSFNKYKNIFKGIDNVVQATQLEENLHAQFGIWLINQIKEEYPDWFDEPFYNKIYRACNKAFEAELKIIEWIFEDGEFSFLSKDIVIEFIRDRFNKSIIAIGGKKQFEIDNNLLKQVDWFDKEIETEQNVDFFNKRSISYSKFQQPITAGDLF